jgi:D-xylose transport system permease protein
MSIASSSANPAHEQMGPFRKFLQDTEIDSRLIGMVIALMFIWIGFHVAGHFVTGQALFLTPRNLWNVLVQTSSISIMATGMVLIIVMRHIDLSVGSILGFVAVVMAWLQVYGLPAYFPAGSAWIWIIATLVGLTLGAAIGALHGTLVAYSGIPSFIVTLSGLMAWRGAAFKVASGETIAPLDPTYSLIGGGPYGSIGSTWSWVVGLIACAAIIWSVHNGRVQRKRFNFPLRPVWAEFFVGAVLCAIVLGTVMLVNSYYWPIGEAICGGQRHHCRPCHTENFPRLCRSGADCAGGWPCDDVCQHAHAIWTLCLFHRRQPGSGGTRRYQYQEDHHHRLHRDGTVGCRFSCHCHSAPERSSYRAWPI